jgi:ATPase subunit of ABC transporter with duplicated ATPase domains
LTDAPVHADDATPIFRIHQRDTGNDGWVETGGKREINSRAYCTQFNFKGSDQQKKVKDLSGAERNRVHLARLPNQSAIPS